jgi:glycosyltransferase involved in cell wall biosynthesis
MLDEEDRSEPNPISKPPDLSLVLPCYNEEAVIRNTAARLIKTFNEEEIDLELILVDNGSQDATGQIIDQMIADGFPVTKVTVTVNQGYGNGILQGLKVCRGKFVGYTCADGQVEATDVRKVYDIAANARSPYLVKVRRRFRMDGLTRKLVSIIYNGLTMVLFGGLGSIDINGNPKIFPAEYLDRMNLQSKDWFLDAETLIKAKQLKLDVFEMNVIAQMREGGQSNVHSSTIKEFLSNLMKYRFGKIGAVKDISAHSEQKISSEGGRLN